MNAPVLCYVKGSFAYFTTQEISKQTGDDWNDIPYEHNAGEPYEYDERIDGDKQRWEIIKVAFDACLETPCAHTANSRYSVDLINAGAVPWLCTADWRGGDFVAIRAGVTIEEFCRLVKKAGGVVYLKQT